MKKSFRKTTFLSALAIAIPAMGMTQDKVEASVGADLVSGYIWRGQDLGGVSIQPTLSVSYKGFSLSAWGTAGIEKEDAKEIDLTLGYTTGGFSISVTDYWFNGGQGYVNQNIAACPKVIGNGCGNGKHLFFKGVIEIADDIVAVPHIRRVKGAHAGGGILGKGGVRIHQYGAVGVQKPDGSPQIHIQSLKLGVNGPERIRILAFGVVAPHKICGDVVGFLIQAFRLLGGQVIQGHLRAEGGNDKEA